MGGGTFQAFREPGRPTYYGENRWPVTADTVVYGILYAFLGITFSFYVVIIGIRGIDVSSVNQERNLIFYFLYFLIVCVKGNLVHM